MNLEVLLSCMHQSDESILERSMINSNVLVVNQCNYNDHGEIVMENGFIARFISTTERGLSKSRNMAVKNSSSDICLLCDDDERFAPNYRESILKAFMENPEADVLIFKIRGLNKNYSSKKKKINYLSALKVSSIQIAFRRESIISNHIMFDETLGSGVSKAGGEEVLFLYNCLRKGLNIYYLPIMIGELLDNDSQWFNGFTEGYFFDRGVFTRKMMGVFGAGCYACYFLLVKYSHYKKDISFFNATKSLCKGLFSSR